MAVRYPLSAIRYPLSADRYGLVSWWTGELVGVTIGMYQDSSPGVRMTVAGGKARNVDFIFIAEGDTTTL